MIMTATQYFDIFKLVFGITGIILALVFFVSLLSKKIIFYMTCKYGEEKTLNKIQAIWDFVFKIIYTTFCILICSALLGYMITGILYE